MPISTIYMLLQPDNGNKYAIFILMTSVIGVNGDYLWQLNSVLKWKGKFESFLKRL